MPYRLTISVLILGAVAVAASIAALRSPEVHPQSNSVISHNHGRNQIHSHWHVHDGQFNHGHTHPNLTHVSHSHEHEHGHSHPSIATPLYGGELLEVGHTHSDRGTKIYWAEWRVSGERLELHFLLETTGSIVDIDCDGEHFHGEWVDQNGERMPLEFHRAANGYLGRIPNSANHIVDAYVFVPAISIEGHAFEFAIPIP